MAKATLRDFWKKHNDTEQALKEWYKTVKKAQWKSPQDALNLFSSVKAISNNRLIFNIKGNKYRLIVSVNYDSKIVFIRFIGTHDEYDEINARDV